MLLTKQLEYVTKRTTKQRIQYHLCLKRLYSLVSDCFKLLITRRRLSIAQANSSFNRLDTYTLTHATPTFITEALCIVTQVQLLLTTVSVD